MAVPEFINATDEAGGFKPREGIDILQRLMLVDVNGDGFEDVMVFTAASKRISGIGTFRLFINYGGRRFIDETEARGLGGDWGEKRIEAKKDIHHCTAFDFNNNGYFDIYIGHLQYGSSRTRLFLNDGRGYFKNSGLLFKRGSKGSGAVDVDGDGFLDLFDSGGAVSSNPRYINPSEGGTLYINYKGQKMIDETLKRFGGSPPLGYQGPVFADFNNDGYPDIFMTGHHYTHCYMYRNDGRGNFTDITDQYDLTFKRECNGADGAVFADINNNGSLDLIVVNEGTVWIHENADNGREFPRRRCLHVEKGGDAAMIADFDNDGYLDIWIAGAQYIYRNEGDFKFSKAWYVPIERSGRPFEGRQASFGDLNNDGKIDLLFGSFEPPKLQFIRNDMPDTKNWLQVNLIGPHGDAGGYGVRVSVFDSGHVGEMSHFKGMRESSSGYMYHMSPTKILHFGGLEADRKYDLLVRLPFRRGEFVISNIRPARRITIDCQQQKAFSTI